MASNINLGKGKGAEVFGLPELLNTLRKLSDAEMDDNIRRVLMRGAIIIRDEARDLAPVETGELRKGIVASYGNKSADKTGQLNVIVAAKAHHSHLVEFGSSHAPAHPFMRPAVTAAKSSVLDTIATGLQMLIEKVTE